MFFFSPLTIEQYRTWRESQVLRGLIPVCYTLVCSTLALHSFCQDTHDFYRHWMASFSQYTRSLVTSGLSEGFSGRYVLPVKIFIFPTYFISISSFGFLRIDIWRTRSHSCSQNIITKSQRLIRRFNLSFCATLYGHYSQSVK